MVATKNPNKKLLHHYCNPIVVADTQWNDAVSWINFTNHISRELKHVSMGDNVTWNANDSASGADWIKRTVVVNPALFMAER